MTLATQTLGHIYPSTPYQIKVHLKSISRDGKSVEVEEGESLMRY